MIFAMICHVTYHMMAYSKSDIWHISNDTLCVYNTHMIYASKPVILMHLMERRVQSATTYIARPIMVTNVTCVHFSCMKYEKKLNKYHSTKLVCNVLWLNKSYQISRLGFNLWHYQYFRNIQYEVQWNWYHSANSFSLLLYRVGQKQWPTFFF